MTRSTAVADRAAIEELARSITDAQWDSIIRGHFPGDIPLEWSYDGTIAALFAYLDRVWAGLSDEEVQDLVDNATPLGRAVLRRARGEGGP